MRWFVLLGSLVALTWLALTDATPSATALVILGFAVAVGWVWPDVRRMLREKPERRARAQQEGVTLTFWLDSFDAGSKRVIARAQQLADDYGHQEVHPLHLYKALLNATHSPGGFERAKLIVDVALEKQPFGSEPAALSRMTLDVLADVERRAKAENRRASIRDLWQSLGARRSGELATVFAALPESIGEAPPAVMH